MESNPVTQTLGQYELIDKVGEGAAGEVYRARHAILEQDYAVKVLRREYVDNDQFTERFLQEARLAARLIHPNIVRVITADCHDGLFYLVMEFIEGRALEDEVGEQPLDARQAVGYVRAVLDALHYAHEQGMLHRDVKAENVLVDRTGRPRLVDFGLVTHMNKTSRLTAQNAVVGTPYYMAPEQWRSDQLDARADVFAAGVLLFYLLSGHFPFPGPSPMSVLHRLNSGEREPLGVMKLRGVTPTVASALEGVVDRALQLDRAHRFASAAEFDEALGEWLERARPTSTLDEPTRPAPEQRAPSRQSSQTFAVATTGLSVRRPAAPRTDNFESISRKERPMNADTIDLPTSPVEIAENTFWVGKRPNDEIFYANPYLRHFPGRDGADDFNLLIDPGSSKDFSVVQAKVSQVLGGIDRVSSIFINHQDPDVGSSVGLMLGRYTPKAYVLCTEDTWRLVQYYNIPRKRFVALEKYPRGVKLPTSDVVVPVPSPFCHFVGAMMLYDPETRVLFTGDLFGGLTDRDATGLYADESDWAGMRAFHQIYMPTQKALKHAIGAIRQLDPPVEVIAPQHGRVITGEYVQEFMRRLENLPVGLDVLDDRFASEDELRAWTTVLERVLEVAKGPLGEQAEVLLADDPNLSGIITFTGAGVEVTSLGKTSVERAVRLLSEHVPHGAANALKYEAVFAANELGLPTPVVELDEEGGDGPAEQREPDVAFGIASAE